MAAYSTTIRVILRPPTTTAVVTPTTTAALLALGEKQRGFAGLLDWSSSLAHRS